MIPKFKVTLIWNSIFCRQWCKKTASEKWLIGPGHDFYLAELNKLVLHLDKSVNRFRDFVKKWSSGMSLILLATENERIITYHYWIISLLIWFQRKCIDLCALFWSLEIEAHLFYIKIAQLCSSMINKMVKNGDPHMKTYGANMLISFF